MDKQKQIEEMAKTVQRDMCGDVPCEECNYHGFKTKILSRYCGTYLIAEKLYAAGYRKIPEGAVLLTNDEFWALSNKFSKKELDEIVEFHKNKTRKETAEKFAEMAKNKAIRQQEFVGELAIGVIEYVKVKDIDEICKEITDKELQNG